MSARDELARAIFIADNKASAEPEHEWEMTTRHNPAYAKYAFEIADGLHAAGYRKPRTITTREELAEAHMVVVRTEAGTIANLVNGRAYCFGYEASAPVETLALPVTVLWEREATA